MSKIIKYCKVCSKKFEIDRGVEHRRFTCSVACRLKLFSISRRGKKNMPRTKENSQKRELRENRKIAAEHLQTIFDVEHPDVMI